MKNRQPIAKVKGRQLVGSQEIDGGDMGSEEEDSVRMGGKDDDDDNSDDDDSDSIDSARERARGSQLTIDTRKSPE